jgi:hypothetical protein
LQLCRRIPEWTRLCLLKETHQQVLLYFSARDKKGKNTVIHNRMFR